MLLVMLIHVSYAVGALQTTFAESVLGAIVQWACMICVNVFVLISGWFGIHYRLLGVWKLIYQTVFLSLIAYILCIISGNAVFGVRGIWHCTLGIFSVYWFVWAYLLLYILSPVLNIFVEHSTRKEFSGVIVGFYVFALYAYFTLKVDPIFSKGFHTIAFIGLYLLGRYMNIYHPRWTKFSPKVDFTLYGFSVGLAVALVLALQHVADGSFYILEKMGNYIAPTTMIGTVFFFLPFTKVTINSKIINWCASSCFAAFILHMQFDMHRLYTSLFQDIWVQFSLLQFWGIAIVTVFFFFVLSVFIDKLRLFTWNKIFAKVL